MSTNAFWDTSFGDYIANSRDRVFAVRQVADVLDLFEEHGVILQKPAYDKCYTDDFSRLLWCDEEIKNEVRDDLKLIGKLIEKADAIDEKSESEFKEIIRNEYRNENLLLLLIDDADNVLCVKNECEYRNCRFYMMKELIDENEFYDTAIISYKKLYFHKSIRDSIKSLRNPFKKMRRLIGKHLEMLNNEYSLFAGEQSSGYKNLAELFQNRTGIECSPQAGREGVKKLHFAFENKEGNEVDILCELHTKLKFRDMNHEEQDRIYFHPPVEGIGGERILIAYIGKHL